MITGSIKLPRPWQSLIDEEFPESLEGIHDARHHRQGLDDPSPYYDDHREIATTLSDGSTAVFLLLSGQSNYYGSIEIWRDGEVFFETEPVESWGSDEEELVLPDDSKVRIRIEWS